MSLAGRDPGRAAREHGCGRSRSASARTCCRSSTGLSSRSRSSICAGTAYGAGSSPAGTCRRRSRSTSAPAYGDLELSYHVEEEPLGTAGGIAFAAGDLDETFFALNGDSLRDADLGEIVRFHRETGAKATILLTPVADPSRYGLVRLAADGRVSTFLEKPRPEEIDTNLINAGMYVLEPEVLEPRPARASPSRSSATCSRGWPRRGACSASRSTATGSTSERPRRISRRTVTSSSGRSRPRRATALGPDFTLVDESAKVHPGARLVPPVYIGPGAVVEDGARAGSLAVLGAGSHLARGALVENAVVGARSTIGAATAVVGSIVGDDADVGPGCEVRNLAVVGPGVKLGRGNASTTGCGSGPTRSIPGPRSPVLVTAPARPSRFEIAPRRVEKPWGWELVWAETEPYVGKLLFVRAGEALSLQYHEEKDESWLVREGRVRIDLGDVGR